MRKQDLQPSEGHDLEQLRAAVPTEGTAATASLKEEFEARELSAKVAKLFEEVAQLRAERQGTEDYYGLRREWSGLLKWLLSGMVIFQIGLTLSVGLGHLDFTQYKLFLELLVGETFAQVAGMCIIVVTCLFPGKKPETDKTTSKKISKQSAKTPVRKSPHLKDKKEERSD